MKNLKQTNVQRNKYNCSFCGYDKNANANSLARHISTKHSVDFPAFEDYFVKYIKTSPELFSSLAAAKVINSPLPIESRLTSTCYECGRLNSCLFQSLGKGFSAFCSMACATKSSLVNKSKHARSVASLSEKHNLPGLKNISQVPGISAKTKRTKLERYGDENYTNPQKQRTTTQARYGVDAYTQTPEYLEKTKATSLRKYGVEHFASSEIVKSKVKQTNMEKYGVESTLSLQSVRDKIKQTNLKNYGVESMLELLETRELGRKVKSSLFEQRLLEYDFDQVSLVSATDKLFKCVVCDSVFMQEDITLSTSHPSRFPRCKECFPVKANSFSVFHQEVLGFLMKYFSPKEIEQNTRKILPSGKEIDIWIPSLNIGFELNGLWWHSEETGRKPRKYHQSKTNEAEQAGIHLVHIYSDDWDKRKLIVKNKILHICKKNNIVPTLGARILDIRIIDSRGKTRLLSKDKEALEQIRNLYTLNHVQGTYQRSSVHIVGTITKEQSEHVVAVMSLATTSNENRVELERFCIASDSYKIPGAGQRLFNKLHGNISNLFPGVVEIVSFADRSWTPQTANLYTKLGFTLNGISEPRHWYLDKKTGSTERLHKFLFRRNLQEKKFGSKFNPNLSEFENMKANGYDRIWDSGLLRYIWTNE